MSEMITLDLAYLLASKTEEDGPARRALSSISATVAKSKKAVVVTGAGISCSCGIPDFRSSDGLYNLVKARYPNAFVTGKDLFSSSLFRSEESTQLFYTFIAELKLAASAAQPSPTHWFIKKLDDKGKLMRSYTQNIDGMEKRVGLRCSSTQDGEVPSPASSSAPSSRASSPDMIAGPSSRSTPPLQTFSSQAFFSSQTSSFPSSSQASHVPTAYRASSVVSSSSASSSGVTMDKKLTKNIQLHGDIHRVRCKVCAATYDFTDEYVEMFREGEAPDCPACEQRAQDRRDQSKRTLAAGVLRPAIVLYDENHPNGDLIGSLQSHDLTRTPDLLLVLGTSLKVHGLKRLVKELARAVHSLPVTAARPNGGKGRVVFVNKTPPQGAEWKGVFDYWVKGECDEWVARVEEEWRKVKKSDWETQTTLDGSKIVKSTKPVANKPKLGPKAKAPAKPKPRDSNHPDFCVEIPLERPSVRLLDLEPFQYTAKRPMAPSSPLSSPPVISSDLPPSSSSPSTPRPQPPLSPSKRLNSGSRPSSPVKRQRQGSGVPAGLLFSTRGEKENPASDDDADDARDTFGSPMKVDDVKGKGKAAPKARTTKLAAAKSWEAPAAAKSSSTLQRRPSLPANSAPLKGKAKSAAVVEEKLTNSLAATKPRARAPAGSAGAAKAKVTAPRLGMGRPRGAASVKV